MAKQYAGFRISYTILGGNLLPQAGDDEGRYNELESVRKYALMAREQLQEMFPGAEVQVDLQENVSGGDGNDVYVSSSDDDPEVEERVAEQVRQIIGELWESWDWVVYTH